MALVLTMFHFCVVVASPCLHVNRIKYLFSFIQQIFLLSANYVADGILDIRDTNQPSFCPNVTIHWRNRQPGS